MIDGDLDMRELRRALWRRRRWIIIPTILACALTAVGVNFLTLRYKSEARILYEGRENIFLRPEVDKATQERSGADQEAVTSQVQLVLSREVALDVIKQLKLNERPEFDPVLRGISPLKYLLITAGVVRDPMRMTAEERVLEAYYERLTAFAIERSRVIAIEFQSYDPELAARAANAIAARYLEVQQTAKQDQTRAAGQWLAGEIDGLRRKVAEAEAKVEQYRAQTNLFVGTNNTNLSNQQLGEFNSQLGAARAQKADAESRAKLIRGLLEKGGSIEVSDVFNSEIIRRLSEQRATLRGQLAEQSSTLLERHPRIKELKAQIADLDLQIRHEAERLVRGLENDARIADARVQALSANLDQLKRQAASTNEQDVELRALEREAKAQRELLESYLARYREANARESIATAPPEARVISPAVVSNTPFFPKKVPTVLVVTLAMLLLTSGVVVTGELLGGGSLPRLRSPSLVPEMEPEVEADEPLHEPTFVAAAAPPMPRPMVAPKELGVPIDALEELAAYLTEAGEAGRRVTVVGAAREVGTTLAALTLARVLSKRAGVVLVDLAVATPNLAAVAADAAAPGIADLVNGTASFGDVITRDRLSRVHIVTAGEIGDDVDETLASPHLVVAIEALVQSYDHVVIDAGAVGDGAAGRLARLTPKAALVVAGTDPAVAQAAQLRLASMGFDDVVVLPGAAAADGNETVPPTPVAA